MVKSLLIVVIAAVINFNVLAQNNGYTVKVASFCTVNHDEFSPVYYKDDIVFCSNLRNNSLISYKNKENNLFNIFVVTGKGDNKWRSPQLFSNELTTNYNEGPITFNETGDTAYYCRNNNLTKAKFSSADNNSLGLYSAVNVNGVWTQIVPFKYNDPSYSLVTPSLSPNRKRLFFASNMAGGFGGADLYYCDWKDNDWNPPVNLGPLINTDKNESYPFACKSGKLFFASEGLPGLGGKDLFYTQEIDGKWISPIHLDSIINSPYDDFGIVTDADLASGYLSSNRQRTDDIYTFKANPIEFTDCDSMIKNNYCFMFYDEFRTISDTIPVKYFWDFGNGIKKAGIKVKHCFPGPGKYSVKLFITAKNNEDSIFSETPYNFELKDKEQIFINAPDAVLAGSTVTLDGLKTNLQQFQIEDYIWNFGEGYITRGPMVTKVFDKKGDYKIYLGLTGKSDTLSETVKVCTFKKIRIFEDYQELAVNTVKDITELDEFELWNDSLSSSIIRAKSDKTDKKSDIIKVKTYLLNDLPVLTKDKIIKTLLSSYLNTIEISEDGIYQDSYILLNCIINVLRENPDLKLEVAFHTTEGSSSRSQEITEKWAELISSYFFEKGITNRNLTFKGYGSSRIENSRSKNEKRLEFIFYKQRF